MSALDFLKRITMGRALMIGMILAAFYYFMVFDPGMAQSSQIASMGAKIGELQGQIQENQKKLDRAAIYKKTAAETGGTIKKLLSLIPEQFGMSDLMRIVSNEAKVAGSSLTNIRPEGTKTSAVAGEFEELSVGIELTGSFLQHMVFLSNLTKIPQILIIKKFEFLHVKDGRADESPTVKLTAEIVAFRYRGDGSSKPAEGGQ